MDDPDFLDGREILAARLTPISHPDTRRVRARRLRLPRSQHVRAGAEQDSDYLGLVILHGEPQRRVNLFRCCTAAQIDRDRDP